MSKIVRIGNGWYDFGTKNESFLLTCQELKTLGIKNWYFPLRVAYPQTGVQDIDPYKEDISSEEVAKVLIESKNNIWYWLREVCHVPVRGVGNFPVTLHRGSCAMSWCYEHNIDFMIDQPRQTWKTTHILALQAYGFLFDFKNCEIPFVHMKEKTCLRNAEIFRDYISALPKYMNPWSKFKKPPGLKSLRYEEHNVSIKIIASADSEVKAQDTLRGATLFSGFLDEWEFTDYINSVMAGANSAIISARNIVRQNGGRACMMFASTPGNLETDTGKAAQRMIDMTLPFSEQLYDLDDEELVKLFEGYTKEDGTAVTPVKRLYIMFTWKQLRKTEAWVKEEYAEAYATGKIAEYRRGVLQQRFRGSDSSIFDQRDIDYIQQNIRQPDYDIFILKKFHLYVYKHDIKHIDLTSSYPYFDMELPYMIGVDIAAGGDGDNTAIVIVNPYTLEVVGELKSPYIGLFDLMRIITFLAQLLPKAIFCPETNSIGKALVDFIQETHLEHRFYHDIQLDITKNATVRDDPADALKRKAKQKQYIGTNVTPKIRNEMFKLLIRHVKEYRHLLTTRFLAMDIQNLVKNKNGKIEASVGEHDDIVMAYNHVIYILYFGYDLTRFGIDKSLCTYERVYEALEEYNEIQEEKTINNMLPYDHPTLYEGQLLHDLTSNTHTFETHDGYDAYGYRPDQYAEYGTRGINRNTDEESLESSDLAFFASVNSNLF